MQSNTKVLTEEKMETDTDSHMRASFPSSNLISYNSICIRSNASEEHSETKVFNESESSPFEVLEMISKKVGRKRFVKIFA